MDDPGPSEQFSLSWNNFHTNLTTEFHALFQGEDLVDVTIAADGKFVQAHKIVLSVCSPYFKELFKINPCKHPIVILQDVGYSALCGLLQFMYCGEVSVCQDELADFLKTAELLQVKGLTGNESQEQTKTINKRPLTPETKRKSKMPRRIILGDQVEQQDNHEKINRVSENITSLAPVTVTNTTPMVITKGEPVEYSEIEEVETLNDPSTISSGESSGSNTHAKQGHSVVSNFSSAQDQLQDGMQGLGGGRVVSVCPICYKEFSTKSNLKIHMRDRHSGEGPWKCSLCSKLVKNKSSLRVHFYQQHRKPKNDSHTKSDINVNSV